MKTPLLPSLLLALALCLPSFPARAIDPTVNTILDIVLQEMAPELKPAKPFVVCLIDTGGNVESCVKSFLGPAAADAKGQALEEAKKSLPFNPDSPDVKLVMEIVQAANAGSWDVVIGKGGPYVARAVICTVFVPPGVKSFGCPVIGYVIEHKASLVKQVLDKLKAKDVPGLVKVLLSEFDPSTVCELIPDSALPAGSAALKDLGCSVVGKILSGAMKLAEAAANLAVEGVDEAWDLVSGGNDYMPYNDYYTKYWRPGYHYGTWLCLDTNGACKYPSGKGIWEMHQKPVYSSCKSYYDDHDHWEEDAEKVCKGMLGVFDKEVKKIAAAMQAAAQVYASEEAPKMAKLTAPGDWGKPASLDRKKQFQQQCTNAMHAKFPFPPSSKQPPVTAWAQVCKAPADKFAAEYAAAQKQVADTVKKLEALGCKKAGLSTAPKISCATYDGFEACKGVYEGKLPCALETKKADTALADELLKQLGTKRCKIVDEVKSLPCLKKDGTPSTCQQAEKIILCSRPWKIDQCKTLLSKKAAGAASAVQCKGEGIGLALFAGLSKQASGIVFKLNGGTGSKYQALGTKEGEAGAWKPATSDNCKTTWDPLSISCKDAGVMAQHQVSLPACQPDPNKDGADMPCLVEKLMEPQIAPGKLEIYQGPLQGGGAKVFEPPPPLAPTGGLPPPPKPVGPAGSAPPVPTTGAPSPAAPALGPPPVLAPVPPAQGGMMVMPQVPGCAPVTGQPGQYACTTREALAGCERLRASAVSGVRACQGGGDRLRR